MSDLAHLRAFVHGKVQGVYYRAFVSHVAKALSLKGFVRNMPDGGVELEVEGEKKDIEKLLMQLHIGPPEAVVEKIDTVWSVYRGLYQSFDVRY